MTTVRSHLTRLSVLTAAALLLLSTATTGCSGSGAATQLENAPIAITPHNTLVSLQNNAGMPLTDVRLTVTAYGNVNFTKTLARLENAEAKEVGLNELTSQDGTTFNPRLSRPKAIKVKATDATGKQRDVEVAWK